MWVSWQFSHGSFLSAFVASCCGIVRHATTHSVESCFGIVRQSVLLSEEPGDSKSGEVDEGDNHPKVCVDSVVQ